jgi:alpha-galactosidase
MDADQRATPPMGWNSWNAFSCDVTENEIREAADRLVETGLRDAGYEYLVVDDCWMADELDEDGRFVPHPEDFPGGIEALAEYVHEQGLKFGIYSSAGTETCQGYPASIGRERTHAEQFAE